MKAKDLKLLQTNILVWGPTGSGKTCLVGQLGSKLELIDLDINAASLRNFKDAFTSQRHEVEIPDCIDELRRDIPGKSFAFMKLKEYLITVAKRCREGTYPYKALCIDSLTRLTEMALRMILQTNKRSGQQNDYTPDQGQYGMAFNEIENLIDIFVGLPIMSILIGHEITNEIDNVSSHEIMIPGKQLPSKLRSRFSEIWYCRNITGVTATGTTNNFVIQTVKTQGATARSCLNIPDGTPMSKGIEQILKDCGVEL